MEFKHNIKSKVLNDLETKGISIIPNFISEKDCQLIDNKLHKCPESAFERDAKNSYFLNFITDKDVFNKCPLFSFPDLVQIITSEDLLNISSEYSGSETYLKDIFSYRLSNKQNIFPWHVDNYNVLTREKDSFKEIVFLLYLSSTDSGEGGTEFLLGSEELTLDSELSKVYWDNQDKDLNKYKSFYVKPEAGKLIVSLAHVIHRGGSNTGFNNKPFNRSMLRWQSTDKIEARTLHYIPTFVIPEDRKSRLFLAGNSLNNIPSSLEKNSDNYPTSFLIKTIIISLQNLIIKIFKPYLKFSKNLKIGLKRSSKRALIKKIISKILTKVRNKFS